MGFIDVGYMKVSLVADHYQYIALLSIVAFVAALWTVLQRPLTGLAKFTARFSVALVVVVFGILTWQQSRLYAGPIPLFEDTLAKNPTCWLVHNNLGLIFTNTGRLQEAIDQFELALRSQPDDATACYNYGNALTKLARPADAILQYREAVRLRPDYVTAWNNLAAAYADTSRWSDAVAAAKQALRFANSQGKKDLAQRIEVRLAQYQAGLSNSAVPSR